MLAMIEYVFYSHEFFSHTCPRPYSSGVVVHMGSAREACSLESDSARAAIVVHLRPIPQIYEFVHGRSVATINVTFELFKLASIANR